MHATLTIKLRFGNSVQFLPKARMIRPLKSMFPQKASEERGILQLNTGRQFFSSTGAAVLGLDLFSVALPVFANRSLRTPKWTLDELMEEPNERHWTADRSRGTMHTTVSAPVECTENNPEFQPSGDCLRWLPSRSGCSQHLCYIVSNDFCSAIITTHKVSIVVSSCEIVVDSINRWKSPVDMKSHKTLSHLIRKVAVHPMDQIIRETRFQATSARQVERDES